MDDATLTLTLCHILGELDGFEWDEDPDAVYDSESIGVWYGSVGEAPDRAVGVRIYGTPDQTFVRRRRVQIWVRGAKYDRAGADRIADAVHARLDKLSREGGISGASRESMSALGADDNGREQRSENYTITLDNEEALL